MKYAYLKKKEIYRRAQLLAVSELPPLSDFYYSKFEGVEWLEASGYKITCQRGGDWLQVSIRRYDPECDDIIKSCCTFTGYAGAGAGYKHKY